MNSQTSAQKSPSRNHATVGDLIQYRYLRGAFASCTARQVITVREDGSYVVEGGFWVQAKDVLTVIPMHQEEANGEDDQ